MFGHFRLGGPMSPHFVTPVQVFLPNSAMLTSSAARWFPGGRNPSGGILLQRFADDARTGYRTVQDTNPSTRSRCLSVRACVVCAVPRAERCGGRVKRFCSILVVVAVTCVAPHHATQCQGHKTATTVGFLS